MSVSRRLVEIVAALAAGWMCIPTADADPSDDNRQLLGEERSGEECPDHVVLSGTPADAKRLTLYGVACFKNERYAQAYTYYHRAYEIDPSDLLRAAMGRSLHELGIYAVAKHYYTTFLDGTSGNGAAKIRKRLEQLRQDEETKAAKIDLQSFPENATVATQLPNGGWVELGNTPMRVALRPGTYRFKYKRPGYRNRTIRRRFSKSDDVHTVEADLYHENALFDATAHDLKKAGARTALASLPLLTTGGIFFGLTKAKFDEAEDYTYRADYVPAKQNRMVAQGHRFQRLAIGFTVVGSASFLTGTILFLRGKALEPKGEPRRPSARLQPVLTPRFLGVRGRF